MSFSVGAMIGAAAASSAAQAAMEQSGQAINNWQGYFFGKKQTRDQAGVSWDQYVKQQLLNWKMYQMESKYDYDLAQKYAENSAKWQMQGLENAGLNPLLAVTDGGSMPQQIAMPSSGSLGGSMPSASGDYSGANFSLPSLTSMVRDISSARLSAATARTEENRPDAIKADIDHTRAQAAMANATTAKTLATTAAELEKIRSDIRHTDADTRLTDRKAEIVDRPKTAIAETADWALRRSLQGVKSAVDFTRTFKLFHPELYDTSHSAKDQIVIGSPHSGKSDDDFEKTRMRFYKDLYDKYRNSSNVSPD